MTAHTLTQRWHVARRAMHAQRSRVQREKCLVRHPCVCFYVHRPATRRCGEQGSSRGGRVYAAWRSGRVSYAGTRSVST